MSLSSSQMLSMQLCTGLTTWLSENTYFDGFFKSFNDYPRMDFVPNETPALSVYQGAHSGTSNDSWNEHGSINIELTFSIYESRETFSKQVITGLEMVRAQLLSNPVYIMDYLSSNYVPGLQQLNASNSFPDLNKLKDKSLNAKNGCMGFSILLKYKINILANQRALWAQNKDFYSPITEIYNTVDENEIIINDLP